MSGIHINHPTTPVPTDIETWSVAEMPKAFETIAFCAPFLSVKRRSDGVEGLLEFTGGAGTGTPRTYFNFRPAA